MTTLIAALLVLVGLQEPQVGRGAIEGLVTRAGSAQPISGARVAIFGSNGPGLETRTDANGRYVIDGLPAGPYNLEVQADGYLTAPDPATGKTIRLTVNESQLTRHDVVLSSVGALAGRILDANREPLSGAAVEVLQLRVNSRGQPTWNPLAQVTTNASGEYRIANLAADSYYVRASKRRGSASPGATTVDIAATYFPGTADARSAAPVEVREGSEVSAEFSLANVRTHSISGKILTPDKQGTNSLVLLHAVPQDVKTPQDPQVNAGIPVILSSEGSGDFQIHGLLPGTYDLFAVAAPIVGGGTALPADQRGTPVGGPVNFNNVPVFGRLGTATIQIRDEDESDVRLTLSPGVEIKGRVTGIDRNDFPPLTVRLNPRHEFIANALNIETNTRIEESNSFAFPAVPAGKYDVTITEIGNSNSLYLADVRAGARSVFDEGLDVFERPIDAVEVAVGFDGGTVEGTANAVENSPVLVVLAPPASRRQNSALFKAVVLESPITDGFRFRAVAPGSYSVFAFEIPTPSNLVPYMSPDFLALHESEGVPIVVEKASAIGPVRLPIIPR